jgi:hypothetical protein
MFTMNDKRRRVEKKMLVERAYNIDDLESRSLSLSLSLSLFVELAIDAHAYTTED